MGWVGVSSVCATSVAFCSRHVGVYTMALYIDRCDHMSYLVGLVSSSSSNLALLTRGELSEVSVVVAFPIENASAGSFNPC